MRWWRTVASAGSVLAIVAMLAWYGFTSAAGQAFAIRLVVERATTALHMPVTVGTIEWQGDRFDLRNLRLGPAGHLLSIRRVRGQLAWQALWRRELHLRNLVVDGARCRPSEWPHADAPNDDRSLPPLRIDQFSLQHVRVRGDDQPIPWRGALQARGRLSPSGSDQARGWDITLEQLAFSPAGDGLPALRATGAFSVNTTPVTLHTTGIALDVGGSHATVVGSVASNGPLALRFAPLRLLPADLQTIAPTVALRTQIEGEATVRGSWAHPTIEAALSTAQGGTLVMHANMSTASPQQIAARGAFTDCDPAQWWQDAPLARVSGVLHLRARHAAHEWRIAHRLRLGPSHIADVTLRSARSQGHGRPDRQHADVTLVSSEGRVHARVQARVDHGVHLEARGAVDVHPRSPLLPADSHALHLRFTAAHAPGQDLRVSTSGGRIRVAGVVFDAAAADVRVAPPLLHIDRGSAEISGAALRIAGVLDLRGANTALTIDGAVDARAAAGLLHADTRGVGTIVGRVTGAWPPNLTATLRLPHATIGTTALTDAAIDTSIELSHRTGQATITAARVIFSPLPASPLRLHLTWAPDGAALVARCDEFALRPWRLTTPTTLRLEDGLAIQPLTVQDDRGASLTLQGHIGGSHPRDLSLRAVHLPASAVCRLSAAVECSGQLDGTAHVLGDVVDADVQIPDLMVANVSYGTLGLQARSRNGRIGLDASLRHPTAGTLTLHGTVPSLGTTTAPLDLQLTANQLDPGILAALFPTHLRHVRGTLTADLHISGPWEGPRLGGEITLEQGSVGVATSGVTYDHVRLRLAGNGSDLVVRELAARTGEGYIEGDGSIHLGGPDRVNLALDLRLAAARIADRPAVSAVATGTLQLRGALDHPTIAGQLELSDTTLRPALLPIGRADLEPDPTIHVIDSRPNTPNHIAPPTVGPPAPVTLDLAIHLGDDCWIKRADATLAMAGSLRVLKTLPEPARLVGRLELPRGWYTFQSHRFTIEGGAITFRDTQPTSTVLDVTAAYRHPEYIVTAKVGGSLEHPALTLFSDPPLPEADVLALLLFGKPTQQLGASESGVLQDQVVAIATGYVAPGLRASVMDALGVDTLDVALPPTGTERIGQVRVGRYVAEDLFVSLAQEFGAGVAQVFGIEYALSRRVSVKASAATNGRGAIDVFWHRRY